MVSYPEKEHYDYNDLVAIMRILRAPGGCVWDREQTHESIRRDFLEEVYEVCEAIDEGSPEHLCEELGDALLQRDMNDELIALCNAHQQNPLAIVYKGMIAMNAKKYEEAIADFSSITPDHPSYLQVVFNRAVCKLNVAGDFQDTHANKNTGAMTPADDAKLKELLNDAKGDFEIARQLDPEQKTVRWAVLLRNIYYNLGEEEKYKELEFM